MQNLAKLRAIMLQRAAGSVGNSTGVMGQNSTIGSPIQDVAEFCSDCAVFHVPGRSHVRTVNQQLPWEAGMALTVTGVQPQDEKFSPCDVLLFEFFGLWLDVLAWQSAKMLGLNISVPASTMTQLESVLDQLIACFVPETTQVAPPGGGATGFVDQLFDIRLCLAEIREATKIRKSFKSPVNEAFLTSMFSDGNCLFAAILKGIPK